MDQRVSCGGATGWRRRPDGGGGGGGGGVGGGLAASLAGNSLYASKDMLFGFKPLRERELYFSVIGNTQARFMHSVLEQILFSSLMAAPFLKYANQTGSHLRGAEGHSFLTETEQNEMLAWRSLDGMNDSTCVPLLLAL